MLDREIYLYNLKSQFKDDIKMILIECHDKLTARLDMDFLLEKLNHLQSYACSNGISEYEWFEIVNEMCPAAYDVLYCPKMVAQKYKGTPFLI